MGCDIVALPGISLGSSKMSKRSRITHEGTGRILVLKGDALAQNSISQKAGRSLNDVYNVINLQENYWKNNTGGRLENLTEWGIMNV